MSVLYVFVVMVVDVFARWTGRKVDLSLLCDGIVRFFEGKGLKVVRDPLENGFQVTVMPKRVLNLREEVVVTVTGDPDDFEVKFVAGDKSRSLKNLGYMTSSFGGGFFLLEGLKSLEAIEKLEREFWIFVEDYVGRLQDSFKD